MATYLFFRTGVVWPGTCNLGREVNKSFLLGSFRLFWECKIRGRNSTCTRPQDPSISVAERREGREGGDREPGKTGQGTPKAKREGVWAGERGTARSGRDAQWVGILGTQQGWGTLREVAAIGHSVLMSEKWGS